MNLPKGTLVVVIIDSETAVLSQTISEIVDGPAGKSVEVHGVLGPVHLSYIRTVTIQEQTNE